MLKNSPWLDLWAESDHHIIHNPTILTELDNKRPMYHSLVLSTYIWSWKHFYFADVPEYGIGKVITPVTPDTYGFTQEEEIKVFNFNSLGRLRM